MDLFKLKQEFINDIKKVNPANWQDDLEQVRIKYLGRKGELTRIFDSFKKISQEKRKEMGQEANKLKIYLEGQFKENLRKFSAQGEISPLRGGQTEKRIDITAPGIKISRGHYHPLTLVRRKAEEIFSTMGFEIVEGPEIETDYYNFQALNIPPDHPARDMWSTFWLKEKLLLRTHTSPVQIRYMENHQPPIRIIAPGRTFRHEATDASHDIQFYQLEGLMIDKNVTLANLKGVLEMFLKNFFGGDVEIRFRPSYFPFVEPGVEVDLKWRGKWLEVAGAGMVHPKVFEAVKYIPNENQGFAFGLGLDRLAMIKYHIDDIRLFYSSDLRFLKQF